MSAPGRPKRSPPPLEGEADRGAVSFGGGYPTRAGPPQALAPDREAVGFEGGYPDRAAITCA